MTRPTPEIVPAYQDAAPSAVEVPGIREGKRVVRSAAIAAAETPHHVCVGRLATVARALDQLFVLARRLEAAHSNLEGMTGRDVYLSEVAPFRTH